MIRAFSVINFILLSSGLAWAAVDSSNSSVTRYSRSDDYISEDFRPSLLFRSSYSMQAQEQADGSRTQSLSYALTPGFSYSGYSYSVNVGYDQDLVDTTKNSFTDPGFTVNRKAWAISNSLNLKASGTLVLPMTDRTKNELGMLYNVGAGLSLSLNTRYLNMDEWQFGVGVAVNRNFTQYDTTIYGEPSNMWRIRQKYRMSYDFNYHLTFSTNFDFTSNYSVNGVVTNNFTLSESLAYSFDRNVSVSIGHSNGGPMLTPYTYDNNMKFYDEKSSNYSLGLSLKI